MLEGKVTKASPITALHLRPKGFQMRQLWNPVWRNTLMKLLRKIRGRVATQRAQEAFALNRRPTNEASDSDQRHFMQISNVLTYSKTTDTAYAAKKFPAGYHEFSLGHRVLGGQRKPRERLGQVSYDFRGKSVLDIGCNQGGMAFAISREAKWVVGTDFDSNMINACNLIANRTGAGNTSFFVHNLDRDPLELLYDFLPESRVDIVFMLSICMWVSRWREVVDFCSRMSDKMLFESNGSARQQEIQLEYVQEVYGNFELIAPASNDDARQQNRRLGIASNNRTNVR